jgi:hypothetical protein
MLYFCKFEPNLHLLYFYIVISIMITYVNNIAHSITWIS